MFILNNCIKLQFYSIFMTWEINVYWVTIKMTSVFYKDITFEFVNTSCLMVSDDQVSLQLCFKLLWSDVWTMPGANRFKMGPIYENTNPRWFWVVLFKKVLINHYAGLLYLNINTSKTLILLWTSYICDTFCSCQFALVKRFVELAKKKC